MLIDRSVTYEEFCDLVADYGRVVICTKAENPARSAGYGHTYVDSDILWLEESFCAATSMTVPVSLPMAAIYCTARGRARPMATRTRLTVKTIESAEPGKLIWDAEIRGLGYRRDTSGPDGSFFINLKPKGTGTERRIKLGRSSIMRLEDARAEAAKLKSAVIAGQDPAQQCASVRQKRKAGAVTMAEGIAQWLVSIARDQSPSTVKGYKHLHRQERLTHAGREAGAGSHSRRPGGAHRQGSHQQPGQCRSPPPHHLGVPIPEH